MPHHNIQLGSKVYNIKNDSSFEAGKIVDNYIRHRGTDMHQELLKRCEPNNNITNDTVQSFFNSCVVSEETHIWSRHCKGTVSLYILAQNLYSLATCLFYWTSLSDCLSEIAIQWGYALLYLGLITAWVKFSDNFQ